MFEPATVSRSETIPERAFHAPLSSVAEPLQSGLQVITEIHEDADGRCYLSGYAWLDLQVATSCLVQPMVGDRVSAIVDQQHLYITAVLSRKAQKVPLVLNSGETPLHIMASTMELHSSERMGIYTPHFSLITRTTQWLAETMHQISQRLFVRAQHAHRQVENTDTVQAKHINQEAGQSYVMDSEIASLNAKAVLKIDGGQVHMG